MSTFAVFGKPILHSKSPQLFNAAFQEMNANSFYIRIRPKNGKDLVDIIKAFTIAGANITTPFKEEVLGYLDELSSDASCIKGVNCVTYNGNTLIGYNTDHYGVTQSLAEAGIDAKGKKALVIGAGPAAAAAAYGLRNAGANVYIMNRTKEKAIEISKRLNIGNIDLSEISKAISQFEIAVSALLPDANPLNSISIPEHLVLLDANYRTSALGQHIIKFGCSIIGGERWLIHQAVASFLTFTNSFPDIYVMNAALKQELNRNAIRALQIDNGVQEKNIDQYDILISASNNKEFMQILNEEISKAFGS